MKIETAHSDFNIFKLHPPISAAIKAAGYSTPTPIQIQAIPKVLQGYDLMGTAQTGTGKTAAFVLPILQRLSHGRRGGVRSLIITPTRELAEQIHQTIELLGIKTGLRSVTIYGGVGLQRQVKQLKKADIIVACPGRLLDHIRRKSVDLTHTEVLVLDEADQMFDMGFLPDIRRILTHLPQTHRQTLLFSATMPRQIRRLATEVLNENHIRVKIGHEAPADTVSHAFYPVAQHLKTALLLKLIEKDNHNPVLVFTRTKHRAKQLGKKLANAGYRSTSLQGNLSQAKRQEAMQGFKSGKYKVLVATDIAARGIDVAKVSHVINYDMPSTAETYIHRIGRTGRADCVGQAFTLITRDDQQMVKAINTAIGKPVNQRTLPDFNYRTPKPQNPQSRRYGKSTLSPNRRDGSHRYHRTRQPKTSVRSSQRTTANFKQEHAAI